MAHAVMYVGFFAGGMGIGFLMGIRLALWGDLKFWKFELR